MLQTPFKTQPLYSLFRVWLCVAHVCVAQQVHNYDLIHSHFSIRFQILQIGSINALIFCTNTLHFRLQVFRTNKSELIRTIST